MERFSLNWGTIRGSLEIKFWWDTRLTALNSILSSFGLKYDERRGKGKDGRIFTELLQGEGKYHTLSFWLKIWYKEEKNGKIFTELGEIMSESGNQILMGYKINCLKQQFFIDIFFIAGEISYFKFLVENMMQGGKKWKDFHFTGWNYDRVWQSILLEYRNCCLKHIFYQRYYFIAGGKNIILKFLV